MKFFSNPDNILYKILGISNKKLQESKFENERLTGIIVKLRENIRVGEKELAAAKRKLQIEKKNNKVKVTKLNKQLNELRRKLAK